MMAPSRRSLLPVLLALAAASCAGAGDRAPVAIGVAAPVGKGTMQTIVRGVELAVEHLNAAGGRTFVMRTPDRSLIGAVEIATSLRDMPDVVGVVGHTDSRSSREAAPIYSDDVGDGRRALVSVSPTSTSTSLTGYNEWFFRVCPSDAASSRAAARYALDSLRVRRVVVMYRNDAYGKGWAAAFSEAFRAGGGTVLESAPHIADMADWRPYVGLVGLLDPELILFPGSPEDVIPFIRALRAANLDIPVLGGDATSELEAKAKEFGGMRYLAFFRASSAVSPKARAFVDAYVRKYGEPPDQRSALAYDAAMLIGRAVNDVGPDRHAIHAFIDAVGRSRPAMEGVTGPIAFDERNDVINKPVVVATVGRP